MVRKRSGEVGFSEALADFAQPLIDDTDGSEEEVSKALMFATLCWNLALLDDESAMERVLNHMVREYREESELGAEEGVEFREMILQMVERHRRMFPAMHKGGRKRRRSKREMRFEKCPVCNATVKSKNMAGHLERVHPRPRIPSAGTLWRFANAHRESLEGSLLEMAEEMSSEGIALPRTSEVGGELERYRSRAETGGHRSVILEVARERDRRLATDQDERAVSEWAYDLCSHLLLDWKLGLEDHLYGQFYTKERCRDCTREDKADVPCEEGLADCLYDDEFDLFERAYVNSAVDKLCRGVEEPEELQVPARIRERAAERQKLAEKVRGTLGGEG